MLDAYLRELERELARRLPREDVQARLGEAEAHLRDGVEGRLELGLDPQTAERESIRTFGDARTIARSAARTALARRDAIRTRCVGAWGACLILTAAFVPIATAHRLGTADYLTCLVTLLCPVALAVAAFEARRPGTLRVAGLALIQGLVLWAVLSLGSVRTADGVCGPYPRAEVPRVLAVYGRLERAWTAYRSGGTDAIKTEGGFLAPDARRRVRERVEAPEYYALDLRVVANRDAAREAWGGIARFSGPGELRREIAAIRRAQDHPLIDLLEWVSRPPVPLFDLTLVVLVPLGVDLVFGGLGAAVFALRRLERGTYA